MAQRASKYLLGYTVDSDIIDNELFPNPFARDKDGDESIQDDDFLQKRSIKGEPLTENTTSDNLLVDNSRIQDEHREEGDLGVKRQNRNHFKSEFDTDSERSGYFGFGGPESGSEPDSRVSGGNNDAYSIRSSIIEQMNNNSVDDNDPSDRFKFLTNYLNIFNARKRAKKQEEQLKVLHSMKNNQEIPLQTLNSNDASSVFELSKLDDFNKFVKLTELNDLIFQKLQSSKPADDNLLNIIKSKDLENNFYNDSNNQVVSNIANLEHRSKTGNTNNNGKRWYNFDWKKNGETSSSNYVKNSELYIGNDDIDVSSDSSLGNNKNNRYLSRKLKVRNLQMISFGGTLGVGLFLNSGKAITIAGGFGTLLAFIICGIIVLATIVSFCEMVTFVSIVDGVSGLSSRFVDDAFGFAVGWLYFISFAFGLAGEMVASVIMLTYYPDLKILENKGSVAGFVTLFLLSVIISNSINVQVFGEIEYISSFVKLIFILIMIICMIVLNRGGFGGEVLGFKYWDYLKSDFDHNLVFGLFRPSFNLEDTGTSDPTEGIGGDLGRFMSLLVAIAVVSFAYSGTEIVCIAACEAKDPRRALPSATKRVFWRIVIFYCLSAFVVSLNLYAGDPRLLRYLTGSTGVSIENFDTNYAIQYVGGSHCKSESAVYAGYSSGSQSPWIVAFQSANLCNLSSAVNGFLVFFAVSCGNAQLYVSSRTMYSLSLQGKAPKILSVCNRHGIPYYSVLFAASFGLLAYICVSEEATVVFLNLSSIIASSGIIVWFAMCLSYIRFYYGLKKRPDIISRDDPAYPYKSFFQPYTAFIGMIGSAVIILIMGYTVFLKDNWDTLSFFANYGTLIIFAICYIVYKFVYGSRIPSLETLDFDSGRREMDRYIWDGNKDYNRRSLKEVLHKWASFLA